MNTMTVLRWSIVSGALSVLACPTAAQTVRPTQTARLPEEFSSVRGVRELADGRILVSDYIDQRVVLVDLERGTVTPRIGKGGGPAEARLPTRLVAIPGDSSLLVDLGNNRLLVLDGQGRAVRSISAERPGLLGVRGREPGGALVYAVPGWAMQRGGRPPDSVRIVRWNPRSEAADTLAVVLGDRMRSDIDKPALTPRIPTVGHAAFDGWAVGEHGVLRIVRAGGYHVETVAAGRAPVRGPGYGYATRLVSAADKEAYVRRFLANSPMSGKGENGGMGYSPQPSAEELAALLKGTEFAARHPMFSPTDVLAASGERLWVGRPAEEGKAVLYDVFDGTGTRVMQVELPAGRRVMAVGIRGVYAVAESEDGIQHLERYALPR